MPSSSIVLLSPRIPDNARVWMGVDIARFGTVRQCYGYDGISPVYVVNGDDDCTFIVHDCAVIDVSCVDPARLCAGGNA